MEPEKEQKERYRRNIMLKEIGEEGQRRLSEARVLVIGAGGLGSPVLMYLAASGIGFIGIADFDAVDRSNLQRQVIHGTGRIGTNKALSAGETISELNPNVRVQIYKERITAKNINDIISGYDFIIDAVDNIGVKFLINDACVLAQKPFCHAGVSEFSGQLMTYVPGQGACFRCLFEDVPPISEVPEGTAFGIIGSVPGVIGSLQALEAQKYITGAGRLLNNQMLIFNGLESSFRAIGVPKNPGCRVCGAAADIKELIDENYRR